MGARHTFKPPKPPGKELVRVSAMITQDQQAAIGMLAAKNDVSLTWIIRKAIDAYIEANQPEAVSQEKSL